MSYEKLAECAYMAYASALDYGQKIPGYDLISTFPGWEQLKDVDKNAWIEAVQAVLGKVGASGIQVT